MFPEKDIEISVHIHRAHTGEVTVNVPELDHEGFGRSAYEALVKLFRQAEVQLLCLKDREGRFVIESFSTEGGWAPVSGDDVASFDVKPEYTLLSEAAYVLDSIKHLFPEGFLRVVQMRYWPDEHPWFEENQKVHGSP